ncbi:pilus assembly PilX N-terminal domain-containing protein [Metabacillus fastidiosus]|uniref:type IV pilus modification PilV family protein n=1 Tax=Metabacillus fastidiosus TaxID=1458 RepID=UPI002DB5EC49|nr:pilus assembly PilX N-terminal domain-containing protein [Metabacillus fastidiosus]MEC2076797.1 pilus assembly PilX N-terminal domain-containing protein [Metabacillus fastidiosus]
MKILKSEKGISLVVVLLITVIFAVLGLAIIGMALSNTKQINRTEENNQAVDLAEMGSDFYRVQLEEGFLKFFLEEVKKNFQTELSEADKKKQVDKNYVINIDELLKKALSQAYEDINDNENEKLTIPAGVANYPITPERASFSIKGQPLTDINEKLLTLEISFKSVGEIKNKKNTIEEQTITTTLTYKIGIKNEDIGQESIDFKNIIKKPQNLKLCKFEDKKDVFIDSNCEYDEKIIVEKQKEIEDSNLIFNKGLFFEKQLHQGIEESTLYITGETFFGKHVKGIEDSNIFINGKVTIGDFNDDIEDSTIVVIGPVSFQDRNSTNIKLKGIEESSLYIQGDLIFEDKTTIEDFEDSLMHIQGNLNFLKETIIDDFEDSLIYVKGSANFSNVTFKDTEDSMICVDGEIKSYPKSKGKKDNIKIYSSKTDKDSFAKYCSKSTSGGTTGDLFKVDEEIKYEYN